MDLFHCFVGVSINILLFRSRGVKLPDAQFSDVSKCFEAFKRFSE